MMAGAIYHDGSWWIEPDAGNPHGTYLGAGDPNNPPPAGTKASNGREVTGGAGSQSALNNQTMSGTIGGGSGGTPAGSTPMPSGGQDYAANYGNSGYGQGYGSQAGIASGQIGNGSGGSGVTGGGSSGSYNFQENGGQGPGGDLNRSPSLNGGSYGNPAIPGSSSNRSGNPSLGSTIQGQPSYGQTGGGFDPASPRNPFNQAQPYGGGPQSYFGQTGFQPGQQGTPQSSMTQAGFQPGQNDPSKFLTMAGYQAGGAGRPPTEAYNRYQGMLADPTSMSANPAYKAIMDASTQATERQQLARGGNGGGTILAELAKTGAGVAGQYLPQMAQMYQSGAQQEFGNWKGAQDVNLGAGNLGQSLYGTNNQTNLGYGNLGNNSFQTGNAANLGYGNLANNMWTNAAQNQYQLGSAYGQMQNGAANTQGAALAQAQINPANNYFQNQLTMSGYR